MVKLKEHVTNPYQLFYKGSNFFFFFFFMCVDNLKIKHFVKAILF